MDANNVRQRLEQVVVQCGFNLVTEKSDKLSHYYEFRHKGALTMTVIRISNHCTDISTWRERYGSINPTIQLSNKEKRRYRGNYAGLNDKYFQKYFFSIVVFDPTTDGVQNCGDVNDGSFFVKQIVYDATKMTNENLVDCENFVKKIASGNITENINYNRIMKKNRIRLTESYLHNIIKEVLNENWMTFMNAARGRKAQADAIRAEREKTFPHSQFASERNEYDDLADELEKHAQHTFQKQHGKNGKPYQYDGESSDYLGRNDYREDDWDYETKHNSGDKYWNGEEADRIGHYRYGNGFPYLKHGELHDDTFDFADGGKEGWSGNQKRKHTMIYDKDGERYSPDFSSVGNEVSKSKDKDYNNAMNNMAKEMNAYYTGKAKYQKGKGWSLDESIRRAIRKALR